MQLSEASSDYEGGQKKRTDKNSWRYNVSKSEPYFIKYDGRDLNLLLAGSRHVVALFMSMMTSLQVYIP